MDRVATGAGLVNSNQYPRLMSHPEQSLHISRLMPSSPFARLFVKYGSGFRQTTLVRRSVCYRSFATESPTCSSTLRKSFHSCLSPPPELKNRQRNVLIHSLAAERHNPSHNIKLLMSYSSDCKVFNIISHLCMCCVA